jgi:hypothetical protein
VIPISGLKSHSFDQNNVQMKNEDSIVEVLM